MPPSQGFDPTKDEIGKPPCGEEGLVLLSHELKQILNLLKQLNPLRHDMQQLLLVDVIELHELLQRLQELLRRMCAVRA